VNAKHEGVTSNFLEKGECPEKKDIQGIMKDEQHVFLVFLTKQLSKKRKVRRR